MSSEIPTNNRLILFKESVFLWFSKHRKAAVIIAIAAVILLLMIISLFFMMRRNTTINNSNGGQVEDLSKHEISAPKQVATPTPSEEAKTEVSPLDGVLVTKTQMLEMQKRRVLGVMIDNHQDSRPQNGLSQADVVYESLAEGGISRFLALYYRGSSPKVGPVRSIRSYFLDWLGEYDDPIFMHIGGSGGPGVDPSISALDLIQKLSLKSVGIALAGNFWRDDSLHVAPHDAYTSTDLLWKGAAERLNWVGPVSLEKWLFKDDLVLANRPALYEISFQWGGWGDNGYQVKWAYDQANNVYLREQGGKKQTDDNTKEQLKAKNVVVQYEAQTIVNDEKHHINYTTIGTGKVLVFRDGRVIEGTWQKDSRTARTQYLDLDANEIKFNRGQTWIEIVPKDSPVSYR